MKETLFIELDPSNLAEDSECTHLILAHYDPESEKYSFPAKTLTVCGQCNRDKSSPIPVDQLILPEDMEDDGAYEKEAYFNHVRLYLAEQCNAGERICPHCVASLYEAVPEEE